MPQLSAVMYFEGGGQLRFDAQPSLELQADLGSWYRGPKGDKGDKGDDGNAGSHASNHFAGGSDEITPADIGAEEAGAAAAAVSAHVGASDPHGDRAFTTSAISTHAGATDPHGDRAYTDTQLANYQPLSAKGAAGGYASLDGSGKIPQAQIPSIAITEYLGEAADQTELLALTGEKGDWAVRTDLGTTWVIVGDDPSDIGDWAELTYPGAPVLSVAGRTGTVTLTTDDLTDMTAAGKALATAANAAAQRAALALGTAAQSAVDDFATGAEGDLAATAVQPAGLTSAISTHAAAVDPHGDRAYTDSELADHVSDSDPHGDRAFATSAISTHSGATDPHGDRAYTDTQLGSYQALSAKGVAGGYASLDGSGLVPVSQIPSIAITEYLGEAADQTELLALVGQKGDWAVRTDLGTTWIITGDDPSDIGDWTELVYPAAPVISVAGKTGTVTLDYNDISGLGTAAQADVDDFATGSEGDLAATAVQPARSVGTQYSLTGGGNLSADRTLSLVNDEESPGANKVYGTDGAGAKGWKDDPAGGGGGSGERTITFILQSPGDDAETLPVVSPFAGTITGYQLLARDVTGTVELDVWKGAAGAIPDNSDSILSAALDNASGYESGGVGDFSDTDVAVGDCFICKVDDYGGASFISLTLTFTEGS